MNIFVLDECPSQASEYHCDKHVPKMIVESAQMLSTAHRVLDGEMYIDDSGKRKIKRWRLEESTSEDIFYKACYVNHPCNIWLRESKENYNWLYELFVCLCDEYSKRFKKTHLTETKLKYLLQPTPKSISAGPRTPFAQCMPDEYKDKDPVVAYRNFYLYDKSRFAQWDKLNNEPVWWLKKPKGVYNDSTGT
jgi:hypothetical protein